MVNSGNGSGGGGCSVFVILLMVFIVFIAGYLLSDGNKLEAHNAIGERALEQAVESIATMAPPATEVVGLRGAVERAQAAESTAIRAQAEAENKRIAAESVAAAANEAKASAERELALEKAARETAENERAKVAAALETAENKLAEVAAALETTENERKVAVEERDQAEKDLEVAYGIYLNQQAIIDQQQQQADEMMIPVVGDNETGTGKLVAGYNLPAMLVVALLGLISGIGVMYIMIPNGRPAKGAAQTTLRQDNRYTYVKMTREEARQYARKRKAA